MSKKNYDWENGAQLEEHSKKKHTILKEYFRQYLLIRCQHIQQTKFKLIIVDGFSGSGVYMCGTYGSPLIFIAVLREAAAEINILRESKNFPIIEFECHIFFNDNDIHAIEGLKKNVSILNRALEINISQLSICYDYYNDDFDLFYRKVKPQLLAKKCNNIIFNLDQCGYSHATSDILKDIIYSWKSAEIILTFMIRSMLAYLSQTNNRNVPLEPEVEKNINLLLRDGNKLLHKKEWLGEVEKITFNHLSECAPYVSPFSISNPGGWQYWLMHFATSYRARQVFNDVLHQDDDTQVHFGRSGLKMLSYEFQKNEGQLYLFDDDSRLLAKQELYLDIPHMIEETSERALSVEKFYQLAYSATPAHCDDIHEMMIENPDIIVSTDTGGKRRSTHTIKKTDILRLNIQKTFTF